MARLLAGSDAGSPKVKPYLDSLGALAGGTRRDGEKLRSAVVISVK